MATQSLLLNNLSEDDIDASWEKLYPRVVQVVQQAQKAMGGLANQYYKIVRSLDIGGSYTPVDIPKTPPKLYEVSFGVTGPTEVKKQLKLDITFTRAVDIASKTLAGSAGRIVTNTGRDTILDNIEQDHVAVGWQRLSGTGSPCYFCAMQISRGPVYRTKKRASFEAHDHDHCFAEPLFRDSDNLPKVQEYADLWNLTTAGKSGKDAINAFRRAYERPNLHKP